MTRTRLRLLGSFSISSDDEPRTVSSVGEQRLLVLLALRDRVVSRASVAAALWPEASRAHAALRLRSALARLSRTSRSAIELTPGGLRLNEQCTVDYRDARQYAEELLAQDHPSVPSTAAAVRAAISALCRELLPDSYDEWVLGEAEDWRLQRAGALEALATALADAGQRQFAIEAARAAVRNEPLRETAHAVLIRAHLAAGNRVEAARAYEQCATALDEALHLSPSAELRALVHGISP